MPAIKSQRLANKAKKYIASIACMPYTPSLEGLPTWMSNFALEVTADLKAENTALQSKLASAREVIEEYGAKSNWQCSSGYCDCKGHEDCTEPCLFVGPDGVAVNGYDPARKWLDGE